MNDLVVRLFFAATIAHLATRALIPLCMKLAQRLNIIDNPDGKIKQHKMPVPYLGGVALFVGFLTSCAFVLPFESQSLFLCIIALSLIVFLGFLDDVLTLSPGQKIMGQIVVSLCLLKAGFYLKIHAFYNPLMLLISFVWLLTMMNAFNLIDIMDGLASTVALSSGFLFLAAALQGGNYEAALLVTALMGALSAFLRFNYPPAQIYMGDTGSLLLGAFFGALPFLCSWGTHTIYGYCAPLLFLAVPLLELGWLISIRTVKGIPFYKASPDHYALILKRYGFSVPFILWASALAVLLMGLPALMIIIQPIMSFQLGILGAILFFFLLILTYKLLFRSS